MKNKKNDHIYINIVNDILQNEEYNKIKTIEHHGVSRFDHCLRVSYYSYRLAKFLRLDYKEVARGGLLHDFFLSDENRNAKDRFISTFNHTKKAAENSDRVFNINEKEKDIIISHMFPANITLPKYAESWIVNLVDKGVGTYEFSRKLTYKFNYLTQFFIIFVYNFIK